MNEMLFMSSLAVNQYGAYRRQVERAAASTVQQPSVPAVPGPSGSMEMKTEDSRAQILEMFARETGMKPDWARK